MVNLQTKVSWRRSRRTDQYHLFPGVENNTVSACGRIGIEGVIGDTAHDNLSARKAREKAASVGEMYCGTCVAALFYDPID